MDMMHCIRCFQEVAVSPETLATETFVCPHCAFRMLYGDLLFISRVIAMPPYFAHREFLNEAFIGSCDYGESCEQKVAAG